MHAVYLDGMVRMKLSISKLLVAILFFISGFSGLIYQVLWVRQFKLLLGSSVVSVSIILAVFMGGLLVGAWWIGKKIANKKITNELKWYGFLEILIGLFGLVLIFILPESKHLFSIFNEPSTNFNYLKLIFNIIITGLILVVPTAAMGATLPLLVNYFTKKGLFRSTIGLFYSINALGGAIASLAAGFYLIKVFGVNGAIYFAVLFNILVGISAILISKKNVVGIENDDNQKQAEKLKETSFTKMLLLVSFCTGFLALAYEVLWVRCLNYIINNSTYTFSIILFVFLLGIAIGSYIVSMIKTIKRKKVLLGVIQVVLAVCGLLIINLFYSFAYTEQFADWFIDKSVEMSSWQKNTGLNLTLSILVFLFPALLMGMSFPILSDLYYQIRQNESGLAVSKVYVYNTFGSILGALVPIFVLIPILGSIKKTLIVLAVVNFIIGLYFIYKSEYSKKWIITITLLILFGYCYKTLPSNKILASLEVVGEDSKDIKPIFYKEGVMATVKVYNKNNQFKSLSIDGVTIASDSYLMKEKMIAHLPFFTDRNIDNALAVGLASGSTVKSILKHSELKSLDVVEIVPSVMNTLKYFNNQDEKSIIDNSKVKIYIDDVVSFLTYTDKRYDLISSDGKFGFLNRANTTMLSQEYYKICRNKLTEKGVFVQWVSAKIPNKHLETILTTIKSVFPYSELFLVRKNLFIVSSQQPVYLNYDRIVKGFDDESIKQDLLNSNFYTPQELLSTYVGQNFYNKLQVNTMNKPVLEYDFNLQRSIDLQQFKTSAYKNFLSLSNQYNVNQKAIKKGKNTLTENSQISYELNKDYLDSRNNYYNANFSMGNANMNDAIYYFTKVVEINHPSNNNDIGVSSKIVGENYFQKKDYKEAIKYFDISITKLPGYSDVYTLRGVSYLYLSDTTSSINNFEKAISLNPNDVNAVGFLNQIKQYKN